MHKTLHKYILRKNVIALEKNGNHFKAIVCFVSSCIIQNNISNYQKIFQSIIQPLNVSNGIYMLKKAITKQKEKVVSAKI